MRWACCWRTGACRRRIRQLVAFRFRATDAHRSASIEEENKHHCPLQSHCERLARHNILELIETFARAPGAVRCKFASDALHRRHARAALLSFASAICALGWPVLVVQLVAEWKHAVNGDAEWWNELPLHEQWALLKAVKDFHQQNDSTSPT